MARNVLGTELVPCSYNPLTGWRRDGCCRHDDADVGRHTLCARMTLSFLNHEMERGNDLITPRPEFRFHGLKPGDRWCVCVQRWIDAYDAGHAPPVVLHSTHERTRGCVPLRVLRAHAVAAASGDWGGRLRRSATLRVPRGRADAIGNPAGGASLRRDG